MMTMMMMMMVMMIIIIISSSSRHRLKAEGIETWVKSMTGPAVTEVAEPPAPTQA